LRAFYDDGTPLGSHQDAECRIDSIAQSWSVLSGAGDQERQQEAMASALRLLVKDDNALIQLLDPPFDQSEMNPGYIKGYAPGVRENGGQYTHAAIWLIMAFAKLGKTELAWRLFDMINPVHHGDNPAVISSYKVEPYVVAADVYSMTQHAGRGGWTWYTGSAGWMYRLILESLLGLEKSGDELHWDPRLPNAWGGCSIRYRYLDTNYTLICKREGEPGTMVLDGEVRADGKIVLVNDGKEHQAVLTLPPAFHVASGQ
jgi:cellobiose phosphorylase